MKKIVHYSSYSLSLELADALESGNDSNTPSLKTGVHLLVGDNGAFVQGLIYLIR
jgi:hypothetical protein